MARKRLSAFTLIELLVVVGILTLLVAILLPSLAAAKRVSKRTYCLSNLHDLGVAMQAYVQVNRERFPVLCQYPSLEALLPAANRRPPVSRGLARELGGTPSEVLACPADEVTTAGPLSGVQVGGRYYDAQETSYEWNPYLNGLPRDTRKVTVGGVVIPLSQVWMMVDFEAFHGPQRLPRCRNYLYPDLRAESEK